MAVPSRCVPRTSTRFDSRSTVTVTTPATTAPASLAAVMQWLQLRAALPAAVRHRSTDRGRPTAATVVDQQQLGALLHLHEQGAAAFDGDLSGRRRRPPPPAADFSSLGWATEFFTGTLDGRTGTLLFVEKARVGADGSARIDATVVYGTGAFEGMHGEIRFVSDLCVPETCTGTYSGELKP